MNVFHATFKQEFIDLSWNLNTYHWYGIVDMNNYVTILSVDAPCFTGCDALTVTVSYFFSQHLIYKYTHRQSVGYVSSFGDVNSVAESIDIDYCNLPDFNWLFLFICLNYKYVVLDSLKPWLLHPP